MKILSIDVGIKNLACCLFDVSNNSYVIESWNIIDLCNENKPKCLCKKKNNSICNNNATFHKDNVYYCKTHASTQNLIVPTAELSIKKLNKRKINELLEICNKYNIKISLAQKKNLILAIKEFINLRCLEKVETVNANNVNLITIGKSICDKLTSVYPSKIDIIIIENQISPIANRMKTIQGMLAQYFIMKGTENIEFVSSINKLKNYNLGKLSYNERKKKGIEITETILKEKNLVSELEIFNTSKKKDDLADCFLQGVWYLSNNSL